MMNAKISNTLSSSMLAKSIASRKRQLHSLDLIESCFEQNMPVPQDANLGGCMGYEWRARIAELPDALIDYLTQHLIPALETCQIWSGAAADPYSRMSEHIGRAQDVAEHCRMRNSNIAKAYWTRPSKQSQPACPVRVCACDKWAVLHVDDEKE